jgi:RHS repeat-associated protein
MNPPNPHTAQTSTSWQTRYTFSGKEKDVETGYSYFGARYYDSDLSVWLSVDALSDKYLSTSPFMYVLGNPVLLIDPNGDSTLFFNSSGKLLHKSHDSHSNSVVVVNDDKLDEFNDYLGQMKEHNVLNDNSHNANLQTMGDVYDIVDIKKWYNNLLDGEWIKSNFVENGKNPMVRAEKKSFLENNNGSISTGKICDLGDEGNSYTPQDGRRLNSSGTIHSHYIGPGTKFGPSGRDRRVYSPSSYLNATRDIMVEGMGGKAGGNSTIRAIYIYNSLKDQDIIINSNSFK